MSEPSKELESPSSPKKFFGSEDASKLQEIPQSFLVRNLPYLLVLAVVLLVAGFFSALILLAPNAMAEPVKACMAQLNSYEKLTDKIGFSIKKTNDEPVTGSFKDYAPKQYAKMDKFEITGEEGTAVIYGTMIKRKKEIPWQIWKLKVEFPDGTEMMIPEDAE